MSKNNGKSRFGPSSKSPPPPTPSPHVVNEGQTVPPKTSSLERGTGLKKTHQVIQDWATAGKTNTVPFRLSMIPQNGLLRGMGQNTPQCVSFAPVHRLGSHYVKSHICSSRPARGSRSLSPAVVMGLLCPPPLLPIKEVTVASSPLLTAPAPMGMQTFVVRARPRGHMPR
jgi:hypothetical protein